MAFLSGIDSVRRVEWARSYLWDIRFEGTPEGGTAPPSPFNEWFPALDVSEQRADLASHTIEIPGGSFKIPHRSSVFEISVTFLDNTDHVLRLWLENWINNEIFKGGKTKPLKECCRILHIAKLGLDRSVLKTDSHLVFPEGQIKFDGNSSSDLIQHQITFVIAGTVGASSSTQSTSTASNDVGFGSSDSRDFSWSSFIT